MKEALPPNLPMALGRAQRSSHWNDSPLIDKKLVEASAAAKPAEPPHPLQPAQGGGIIYIGIAVASRHDNQTLLGDKNVINHNKGREEAGLGR